MGQNIWQSLNQKVQRGPMALFFFSIGLAALIVGVFCSYEDSVSSYHGLQSLQSAYGLRPASHPFIVYVMSVTPQIGQMVFFALWTLDTSRRWALGVAILWFALDFVSDIQYRSADTFIPMGGGANIQWDIETLMSAALTLLFFTVGAELFLTAGIAIVTTLFGDAVQALADMYVGIGKAIRAARETLKKANREARGGGGGSGNRPTSDRPSNDARPPVNQLPNRPGESRRPRQPSSDILAALGMDEE